VLGLAGAVCIVSLWKSCAVSIRHYRHEALNVDVAVAVDGLVSPVSVFFVVVERAANSVGLARGESEATHSLRDGKRCEYDQD
jgi:hypothetical protein